MTYLGTIKHPKGWSWVVCDACKFRFWSDDPEARKKRYHECADCESEPALGVVGFDGPCAADRQYHGGRFHGGEW